MVMGKHTEQDRRLTTWLVEGSYSWAFLRKFGEPFLKRGFKNPRLLKFCLISLMRMETKRPILIALFKALA